MVKSSVTPVYRMLRRVLLVFMSLLILVLGIQVCLHFLILPRMQISQILLESTLNLPDALLLSLGGLTGSENYISLDSDEIRKNFETSPLIRKAYVEKQFPGTLKIIIYRRVPLGIALLKSSGKAHMIAFDEYGVVFDAPGVSGYRDLPVLSGMVPDEKNGTKVLPESLYPLLQDLKILRKNSPLLYGQISEISVRPDQGVLNEIRLYISSYKLPVVVSSGLTETLMKKILLVLDSLNTGKLMTDLEYADFRTEQVVLKTREGN
ncbi:FtsQ-type POTRA domain-containing protein [Oceanispirochaeta sp.]|jgi:cell division septal protein FtsQ|uniref:cell division protein FtsQ/DivIB n=1 Tax=Oceanispirochaeta sp. TaxID=2035350 RepID=UPI00260EB107|nr:FtsQ-type POTRA domain-containing protein [Oceanispirochaeta sp.]MDA3956596.1 FtsQ-type POTRA domain-containing protein [Oceanispirochaeta sp.]